MKEQIQYRNCYYPSADTEQGRNQTAGQAEDNQPRITGTLKIKIYIAKKSICKSVFKGGGEKCAYVIGIVPVNCVIGRSQKIK
ncbi:unnamed protein product, partial [marine sediment metagenome]